MSPLTRSVFFLGCFVGVVYGQQFAELKSLVKFLNRIHNYETISMFLCESMYQKVNSLFPLIPTTEDNSQKPTIIITKSTSYVSNIIRILNGHPLSIVISDNQNNAIMGVVKEVLRGIRHNPIVFYFHKPLEHSYVEKEVMEFCRWVEYYQFPNSMVMFNDSAERYGCDWYPIIKVINQTTWSYRDLLRKSGTGIQLDLRGKIMKMPIAEDKPRTFTTFYNETSGEMRLSGFCWKVFEAFMTFSNGKIAPYPLYREGRSSFRTINDILDLIDNQTLQISPNGYANLDIYKYSASYPIRVVDYCAMVPVVSQIPSYMYLITPFQENVQVALVVVVIASSFMIFFISEFKSLSLSFLNSVSGILNSNFTGEISEVFVVTSRCFQMLVRLYGFVFTNYYNCLLASFLATTLYGEQIDTFQQLADAHVKTLFLQEDYDYIAPLDLPRKFRESFTVEDAKTVFSHRLSLNASYAYMLTSDKWEYHELQQYYMDKPIMRFSKICVGQFFLSLPLYYDSLFSQPLNYFVMKCLSSGLIVYWKTLSFRDLRRVSNIHPNFTTPDALPMDLKFFRIAWECITFGLICSLAAFFFETFWFFINFKKLRFRLSELLFSTFCEQTF